MSKTTTFTKLLEQAQSPVQTHILLAQLKILRKADAARVVRDERGGTTEVVLTALSLVLGFTIWTIFCTVLGQHLDAILKANGF